MKFKDIKVGDTVYVKQSVEMTGGWSAIQIGEFYTPAIVSKVMASVFDAMVCDKTEPVRFYKKDGTQRGGTYPHLSAKNLGELVSTFQGDFPVANQIKEYRKAQTLVERIKETRYLLDPITNRAIDWRKVTVEDCDSITNAVNALPKINK